MDEFFDPGLLRENPRQMSAATLAFLGDAVYELLTRQKLAVTTIPAGKLHRMAIGMVCAGAQSQAYEVLEPLLSEEELAVLKRGRNTHPSHTAKNAKVADYRRATGVEALFGYLWLSGRTARLRELFDAICAAAESAPADLAKQNEKKPPGIRFFCRMPGGFLVWWIGEESNGGYFLFSARRSFGSLPGCSFFCSGRAGFFLSFIAFHFLSAPIVSGRLPIFIQKLRFFLWQRSSDPIWSTLCAPPRCPLSCAGVECL